jgi:hypothetical protein
LPQQIAEHDGDVINIGNVFAHAYFRLIHRWPTPI